MARSAVIENSSCSENTNQRGKSTLAAPRLDIDHGLVDVRTRSVENSSLLESSAGLVDSRVSIHGQADSIQRRDKVSCLQRKGTFNFEVFAHYKRISRFRKIKCKSKIQAFY